jgi:ankyrin repeat protein
MSVYRYVNSYGWTALHYAAVEGQFAVVEHLISLSVDINARDKDGTTAALRARGAGHDDVVCLMASAFGSTEDLLYIDEDDCISLPDAETEVNSHRHEPLYATVSKIDEHTSSGE